MWKCLRESDWARVKSYSIYRTWIQHHRAFTDAKSRWKTRRACTDLQHSKRWLYGMQRAKVQLMSLLKAVWLQCLHAQSYWFAWHLWTNFNSVRGELSMLRCQTAFFIIELFLSNNILLLSSWFVLGLFPFWMNKIALSITIEEGISFVVEFRRLINSSQPIFGGFTIQWFATNITRTML